MNDEEVLVEDDCPYYELGDLWMCQFCDDACSRAGKSFEDENDD